MRNFSVIARIGVGIFFAIAAGAKAGSPGAALQTISWLGIPATYAHTALVILVIVEAAMAISLVSWPSSLRVRQAGVAVLCLFTVLLVSMVAHKEPPACGCLGLLYEFKSARNELLSGIARNLLLVAVLLWDQPARRMIDHAPTGREALLGPEAAPSAVAR